MIQVYPHEAWCPHCHVSHPPGTRRCLHCGGGVLPVRPYEGMRSTGSATVGRAAPGLPRGPIEIPTAPEIVEEGDEGARAETSPLARPLRIGLAGIWVLLAVAGALVRACSERG